MNKPLKLKTSCSVCFAWHKHFKRRSWSWINKQMFAQNDLVLKKKLNTSLLVTSPPSPAVNKEGGALKFIGTRHFDDLESQWRQKIKTKPVRVEFKSEFKVCFKTDYESFWRTGYHTTRVWYNFIVFKLLSGCFYWFIHSLCYSTGGSTNKIFRESLFFKFQWGPRILVNSSPPLPPS